MDSYFSCFLLYWKLELHHNSCITSDFLVFQNHEIIQRAFKYYIYKHILTLWKKEEENRITKGLLFDNNSIFLPKRKELFVLILNHFKWFWHGYFFLHILLKLIILNFESCKRVENHQKLLSCGYKKKWVAFIIPQK